MYGLNLRILQTIDKNTFHLQIHRYIKTDKTSIYIYVCINIYLFILHLYAVLIWINVSFILCCSWKLQICFDIIKRYFSSDRLVSNSCQKSDCELRTVFGKITQAQDEPFSTWAKFRPWQTWTKIGPKIGGWLGLAAWAVQLPTSHGSSKRAGGGGRGRKEGGEGGWGGESS